MIVTAFALGSLTACASSSSEGATADGGLTLATIKSPIQLLRNETADRIDPEIVDDIVQPTDASSACKSLEDDPDERWRTWQSGVLVLVDYTSAPDVNDVIADLVSSYTDQGWTETDAPTEKTTRLVKDTTFATIDVRGVQRDKIAKVGGQVQIVVGGPCVETDGPASAEVRSLENLD
jgi:hypothetical protein